jgi:hypothetical protein
MSVNNFTFNNSLTKEIHGNYKFDGSAFVNPIEKPYLENQVASVYGYQQTYSFTDTYSIPLNSVRGQVFAIEQLISDTKYGIEENILRKLYINSYVDVDLLAAHNRVWKEVCIYAKVPESSEDSTVITKSMIPSYICYDEYRFAQRLGSVGCRRLIAEYDEVVSQSTFSYFFQVKKLLDYFANEINNIKTSLLFDFPEDYETESQQKIALRYDTWAKMALHYTRRIASTIVSKPGKISNAEVDQISKKQAAQFQAFFAIKLNAVDEEINNLLDALKRDLVDNSNIFYSRYLSNALKMTEKIVEPLDLEFNTTNFKQKFPELTRELVAATFAIEGNFTSVHADLIERFENMLARADAVMMLIHEKRKYSNYISQLATKAVPKKKILETIVDDKYSRIFRSANFSSNRSSTFNSSHSSLDDLEEDSHPQYLLKDGGTITGNISVANNAKIDGVSISTHAHTGTDGSSKISILDIDYSSVRNNSDLVNMLAKKPLSISIDSFISDIIDGGIPVFDAVVAIEIDDNSLSNYEYEIIYTEIG